MLNPERTLHWDDTLYEMMTCRGLMMGRSFSEAGVEDIQGHSINYTTSGREDADPYMGGTLSDIPTSFHISRTTVYVALTHLYTRLVCILIICDTIYLDIHWPCRVWIAPYFNQALDSRLWRFRVCSGKQVQGTGLALRTPLAYAVKLYLDCTCLYSTWWPKLFCLLRYEAYGFTIWSVVTDLRYLPTIAKNLLYTIYPSFA